MGERWWREARGAFFTGLVGALGVAFASVLLVRALG